MSLSPEKDESPAEFLARVEAARGARRAAAQGGHDMQKAIDLAAINDIEDDLGDSAVAVLEVPFVDGMPCLIAVRRPTSSEVKRYRESNKVSRQGEVDTKKAVETAEQLGKTCRVYPDAKQLDQILDLYPSVASQMGLEALKLGQARAVEDAKS